MIGVERASGPVMDVTWTLNTEIVGLLQDRNPEDCSAQRGAYMRTTIFSTLEQPSDPGRQQATRIFGLPSTGGSAGAAASLSPSSGETTSSSLLTPEKRLLRRPRLSSRSGTRRESQSAATSPQRSSATGLRATTTYACLSRLARSPMAA